MKFKSEHSYDKLRGGYYTPAPVAQFLTSWALAEGADSILEPSCGDGALMRAALASPRPPKTIHGVELAPEEAAKAQAVLGRKTSNRQVFSMDFLRFAETAGRPHYDAVVGNPPYIRYQFLSPETQTLARNLYRRHGLPFTKHLNAWAPFVVDSLDRLASGGRLAMVVPAELLNVIHAGGLRFFLLEQCSEVVLVDTETLMFEKALQGTVLLLARKRAVGQGGPCRLAITFEKSNGFLSDPPQALVERSVFTAQEPSTDKWMGSLLTTYELDVLREVTALPLVSRFDEIAKVSVGIVTGSNSFFLVPDDVVKEFDLHDFARPMFGRSAHCRGAIYSSDTHEKNRHEGLATNFLDFGSVPFGSLPIGAQRYIENGEADGLHLRYKCRIRDPWYQVPSLHSSPLALLKRSHEAPRLISNQLGALTTDTAYRVTTELSPDSLSYAFFNSLTALSAEMRGRAYGGGVLELVPSEIRSLWLPTVSATTDELKGLDAALLSGRSVESLLGDQDKVVLSRAGLTKSQINVVQGARRRLMQRRLRKTDAA